MGRVRSSGSGLSRAVVGAAVMSYGMSQIASSADRSSKAAAERERRARPEIEIEERLGAALAEDSALELQASRELGGHKLLSKVSAGMSSLAVIGLAIPAVSGIGLAMVPIAAGAVGYGAYRLAGSLLGVDKGSSAIADGLKAKRLEAAASICALGDEAPGVGRIRDWKSKRHAACEVAAGAAPSAPSGPSGM